MNSPVTDTLSDEIRIRVEGHLKITEYKDENDTQGVVLLNKRNAIHPEHMSILIARAVADRPDGTLYTMYFGSGGATVDPLGDITYAVPNTTGSADLNNPTYFEVIDDNAGAPSGNYMIVRHINGTLFSDVEIHCVLSKNEPFTQVAFDSTGGQNINSSSFTFNEIGLKTQDDLLITHVVFSPIIKSSNRIIEVVYDLRFRMFS